jgi:hypothetical protein
VSTRIDQDQAAARRRASLLASLHQLTDYISTAAPDGIPGMPMTFQLPVPDGLDHEGRLAWLERTAAAWGVPTAGNAMGRHARKRFGDLLLTASVADPDRSVSGHKTRFAAAQAANGMGATA